MASQFFLSLLLFVSLTYAQPSSISPDIQQACKATRYPTSCTTYLKSYPHNNTLDIIQSAIDVAYDNLNRTMDVVWSIMNTTGNANSTRAAGDCHEFLRDSADCILSASVILQTRNTTLYILPRLDQKDARAYMGSALKYQYDCGSALKYANGTKLLNETMSYLNVTTVLTGDALSMLFASDVYGNEPASWTPPRTERDGLWEAGWQLVKSGASLSTGISDLRVNVTVCKDGLGRCLKTIKEALDMAPQEDDHRKFMIHIKEGVYEETVRVTKPNVVFWGDGIGKTVITGSLNGGQLGLPTYHTATVGVEGDRFMATGLTIQNTAGPDAEQAVAFRSTSDLSIIENCEFLGNHGTLYAHGPNQFYKSCRIEGNVDFIFGNGAAVFQDCKILVRPGQLKPEDGETNVITAQGRLDPAQMTGFVFLNCLINGTEENMRLYNSKPQVHNTFLGRPSNEYSRTVFIKCTLEALVSPQGWTPWDGDFALKTLFYGEYGNTGPGSNMSQRVPWSSMIPPEQIERYYVKNFLRGKRKFKHIPSRISLGETVRI